MLHPQHTPQNHVAMICNINHLIAMQTCSYTLIIISLTTVRTCPSLERCTLGCVLRRNPDNGCPECRCEEQPGTPAWVEWCPISVKHVCGYNDFYIVTDVFLNVIVRVWIYGSSFITYIYKIRVKFLTLVLFEVVFKTTTRMLLSFNYHPFKYELAKTLDMY